MLLLEPISPGYIIHIENDEQWKDVMSYVREHGGDPISGVRGRYEWLRLRYFDGRVYCTKGDYNTYHRGREYRDYVFLEFSEIGNDTLRNIQEFFDEAMGLMGGD